MFAPRTCDVVLRAHSVRGEPRIQRNASGVVTTTSVTEKNPSCYFTLLDG